VIKRLRPAYTNEELARVYAQPYAHDNWPDHVERVEHTARFLARVAEDGGYRTVADLSCGDGAVVRLAHERRPFRATYLGDVQPGHWSWLRGPITETMYLIPCVDVLVLSETLEHLDEPLAVLRALRERAGSILVTTPCGEWDDGNPQHYWGWDEEGVRSLLEAAEFRPYRHHLFTPESVAYYTFQVWAAS
jgi:hypothetical protein